MVRPAVIEPATHVDTHCLDCKEVDLLKLESNDKKENCSDKRKKKKQNKVKVSQPILPAKVPSLLSRPEVESVERISTKKRAAREAQKSVRKFNKANTPMQQDRSMPASVFPANNTTSTATKPAASETWNKKKGHGSAKNLTAIQNLNMEKHKPMNSKHDTEFHPQNWYSPFSTGLEIDIVPRSPPSPGMSSRDKRCSSGHNDYRLFSDTASPGLPTASNMYSYYPLFSRNSGGLPDDYGLQFARNVWSPSRSPSFDQSLLLHVSPPSPPQVPYSLDSHSSPSHGRQPASSTTSSVDVSPPLLSRVVGRSPIQQNSSIYLSERSRDYISLPDLATTGLSSSQQERQLSNGEQKSRERLPQYQTYASAASSSLSFASETKYFSLFARHSHH
ncbi:hypothetical protein EC973_003245 [Apophysomyces ossiformis]|uniref:Uncharacterized protein n=1 Tax=Apophysomyces ossiformis TaxID=679940 RepID=A0A8H7BZF2_9FUNG|nr:hypothetical protein EC973_003245 [Apophysomyces ossiformis]